MTFVSRRYIWNSCSFPTACLQNQVVSNTSSHKVSQRTSAFKKTSQDVSNKKYLNVWTALIFSNYGDSESKDHICRFTKKNDRNVSDLQLSIFGFRVDPYIDGTENFKQTSYKMPYSNWIENNPCVLKNCY